MTWFLGVLEHFFYGRMPFLAPTLLFSRAWDRLSGVLDCTPLRQRNVTWMIMTIQRVTCTALCQKIMKLRSKLQQESSPVGGTVRNAMTDNDGCPIWNQQKSNLRNRKWTAWILVSKTLTNLTTTAYPHTVWLCGRSEVADDVNSEEMKTTHRAYLRNFWSC